MAASRIIISTPGYYRPVCTRVQYSTVAYLSQPVKKLFKIAEKNWNRNVEEIEELVGMCGEA